MLQFFRIWLLSLTRTFDSLQLHIIMYILTATAIMYILTATAIAVQG
jgi:hypothetical protein